MGLLDAEVIDDLLHSSSISKGMEKTMERMINELELDSMYIIHYEKSIMKPEVVYDWESSEEKNSLDLQAYIDSIEEWYHFDEEDIFVANEVEKLSAAEKKLYGGCGYESAVEFRLTNHGNIIGYIFLGWKQRTELSDEDVEMLHVLLKLMNELLIKQFYSERMGDNDWKLFKLTSAMTKTLVYIVDDDYKIQFINHYGREQYPNIKAGDYCYKAIKNEDSPCKGCRIEQWQEEGSVQDLYQYVPHLEDTFRINGTTIKLQGNRKGYLFAAQNQSYGKPAKQWAAVGRKFIFALKSLYKDIIAVEIRRDCFYNLFEADIGKKYSYSMDFVLKWLPKIHLDDKQKFLECFDVNFLQNAYLGGVTKKEIDFRYRTHEGSYHCMNGQILFEQNTNKEVTVYILFQDVEQARSAQIEENRQLWDSLMAARSSAELKGEVLANISHEIRIPMGGIISMSGVAKQIYKQEDRLLDCLENIDAYADHMMQVMDKLLETVKVDNEAIVITRQPFRLENLLSRIDIAVREKIEKKNVQFYMECDCRYNRIIGDEIRIYQTLSILINHAVSYTPISGKIRLLARQIAVDGKTVYIRFVLESTGNGLTEKLKESVFGFSHEVKDGLIDEEHFELSLASRVIELMGGQIGIDVKEKETQLYFNLPFGLCEAEKEKSVKRKSAPEANDFSGKRILLAEDSEMIQDAIRAVLEVVGFQVDTADNGKKATIKFISQPAFTYDAILMDVHMPYMDGREAARCIRISGKEDGETVPIIGLMSNTHDEDVEESLQVGMQAHLAKPVNVDKLYNVLRKVIPSEEEKI